MKKRNKTAFTLVELIVVITILAILGTIAFISLQGYSKQARDSRRIADISNIKTSLEIFALQKGNYPSPDNGQLTTYSGDTVWTQGTIGDNVTTNLSRNLSKKPVDPLFETEYIYSVTYSQKEYELLSIHEGDLSFLSHPTLLLKERELSEISPHPLGEGLGVRYSYAASSYNTKVDGNYNQIFVLTQSYIIPTPSIINSSLDGVGGILTDTTIDSQVITNGTNVPSIGNNIELLTGGLDITLSATGLINENSTTAEKESVIQAIQTAYSSSPLSSNPIYSRILNTSDAETLAEELILNTPSGTSETTEDSIPNSIASCVGENNPTPFSATTTYPGCDIADIIVCSGTGTGYTISSCNVGANTGSTDWTVSGGEYFQWGRNKGFVYGDTTEEVSQIPNASYDPSNDTYGFVYTLDLSSYRYDWIVNQDNNLWGNSDDTVEARQGPCLTGYHVPSENEWDGVVTAGQWSSNGANMQTVLKLPYPGYRNWHSGLFLDGGIHGYYWSSSPDGTRASYLYFSANDIYISYRANGFSVRCFKN